MTERERKQAAGEMVDGLREFASPEPLVCAIMLTCDRPEMAARAVRCFEAQTYARLCMVIYDNGDWSANELGSHDGRVAHCIANQPIDNTVGALRNQAVSLTDADIVVHWDDDDWSHPYRIAEQVALLQASDREAVGYEDILFWRDLGAGITEDAWGKVGGEAWLYSHGMTALGTSLCYWRTTWERHPFPDRNEGEDREWLRGVDCLGTRSFYPPPTNKDPNPQEPEPRMIAHIHGRNTSSRIDPASNQWRRVPEWDAYCRERMVV